MMGSNVKVLVTEDNVNLTVVDLDSPVTGADSAPVDLYISTVISECMSSDYQKEIIDEISKNILNVFRVRTNSDITSNIRKMFEKDCDSDIAEFIENTFAIKHYYYGFTRDFNLYPYQANIIDEFEDNDITMVSSSRCMGLTSMAMWYAASEALLNPNRKIMFMYPRFNQCKLVREDFHDSFKIFSENLGRDSREIVKCIQKNSIKLYNGSEIIFSSTSGPLSSGGLLRHVDTMIYDNSGYDLSSHGMKIIEEFLMFDNKDMKLVLLNSGSPEFDSTFSAMSTDIACGRYDKRGLKTSTFHVPWYMGTRNYYKKVKSRLKDILGEEAWNTEYSFDNPFLKTKTKNVSK